MIEQFCNYEIALKLKKLGFNEPCFACYTSKLNDKNFDVFWFSDQIWGNVDTHEDARICKNSDFQNPESCSTALYEQIYNWFLEKYSIIIDVHPIIVSASETKGFRFTFEIYDTNTEKVYIDDSALGFLTKKEAIEKSFLECINMVLVTIK